MTFRAHSAVDGKLDHFVSREPFDPTRSNV